MEQGRTMAMAAVNKMTAMEQTHLNFSHCISEKKLVQMSKAGVPGVPKGLKETSHSCVICQHAKIIRNLQSTTNVHDRQGPYGMLPAAWQDAGSQLMLKVTNAKLAEYLIGMSSVIPMPRSYWPEDGCQLSMTVMEHRPSRAEQRQ